MLKFEPVKSAPYKWDYLEIAKSIRSGEFDKQVMYRTLTKHDLFFVVYFVMEIPGANRRFVVERCREVEATMDESGWLDLWARFHYKSSVITKGVTLQRIFRDPEKCTGIFSHTRPTAKKHFRGIKQLLEASPMLKEWFPDVLYQNPVTEAPKWSEDDGIIVKRKSLARSESTVEAWGLVEGMPTGAHFDYLMFDDVETDETVQNPDVVTTVNRRFDLAMNLKSEKSVSNVVGTPYSHLGTYTPYLLDKRDSADKPVWKLRRHAVVDELGTPALLTAKEIADLKASTDPYIYSCQQMCDPTPTAERMFNPDNLQPIEDKMIPKNTYSFMVIDPAGDSDSKRADSWAMGVFHVEPKLDELGMSRIFIKDLVIDQMKTDEATDAAVKMYLRNGMIQRLGVEKVGQATAEIHIASALRAKGRRVDVRDKSLVILTPAGREKKWRIDQALRRPINSGMWYYSRDINHAYIDRIKMEMTKFPYWYDDGLDMMAYLYDMTKDYRFLPFFFETPKSTNKLALSYASK